MTELETIATVLSTIISWLVGKKYLLPHFFKLWEWITNKKKESVKDNIDAVQELLEIKEKDVNLYESQINFLNEQIKSLHEHLAFKEAELDKHYQLQDQMKDEMLELSKKVYMNERRLQILQDNVCYRFDCKLRLHKKENANRSAEV